MTEVCKIAIIKENKISKYDYIDKEKKELKKEELKEELKKYVEIREIKNEDLMYTIVNELEQTPEMLGSTSMSYQDDKNIYQICHLDKTINVTGERNEIVKQSENGVCNILSLDEEVKDKGILIKSKINEKNICEMDNVKDIDEIIDIIEKSSIYKGVKIDTEGNIEEKKYIDSPEEIITEKNKIWYGLNIYIYKFELIIYLKLESQENNKLNKKATRLIGNYKIYGDVYIVSRKNENQYLNITKEMYEKMDKTLWGDIKSRELTKEELKDGEMKDGLPIVLNRYRILNNRYNNVKKEMKESDNLEEEKEWKKYEKKYMQNVKSINEYIKLIIDKNKENNN